MVKISAGRIRLHMRRLSPRRRLRIILPALCVALAWIRQRLARTALTGVPTRRGAKTTSRPPRDDTEDRRARFEPTKDAAGEWATPTTIFTGHISEISDHYNFTRCESQSGDDSLDLVVTSPDSVPEVRTGGGEDGATAELRSYADALRGRVFGPDSDRTLPGNVTLCVSSSDMILSDRSAGSSGGCLGSSSPGGYLSIFNFQAVRQWSENRTWPAPLPWEDRRPVPVFRGSPWVDPSELGDEARGRVRSGNSTWLEEFLRLDTPRRRVDLVSYSFERPDLVDARLTGNRGPPPRGRGAADEILEMWDPRGSGGMQAVLPFDSVPKSEYYTSYRSHVVMGGFGAAFRTHILLRQGIAVVLQSFPYEEWYVRFMRPFVEYVPLAGDLSNLTETLEWVRDNDGRVREIALAGREFYRRYLSYGAMEEFFHELAFRLALRRMDLE